MAKYETYVKTGQGPFTRWGNRLSLIPGIGGFSAAFIAGSGALIDTLKWAFRGKFLSAATALTAGVVSATVNFATNALPFALGNAANAGTAALTGVTLGTHARKLTENTIGGLAGLVGQKPIVLRSYHAGTGAIGGAAMGGTQAPQQPGYWANHVAQSQGRDPQQRWQQYVDESRRDAAMAGSRG